MAEQRTMAPIEHLRALRQALLAIRDGRRVSAEIFTALKRGGYVGGTRALPAVTARGTVLMRAELKSVTSDAQDSAADKSTPSTAFQVPDSVSRLARPRKGEASLLEAGDVAAAGRLQQDLHRGGIVPRTGQNWSIGAMTGGSNKGAWSTRDASVGNLDARKRVDDALTAVGPEFSGLLLDVCLFEKSLSVIERERQWPARSGKLAIALGLKALARHYGLDNQARGR